MFCGFAESHYQLDEDTLTQYNRDKGIHNFMQDLADELCTMYQNELMLQVSTAQR